MTRARSRLFSALIPAILLAAILPLGRAANAEPVVPVSSNLGCDPLDPAACLLPFPNDFFTTGGAPTDTGRRVNLNSLAMPRTGTEVTEGGEGKPVDPTEWNRNDGFSPGSMAMTYVEGIDLHVTWGTQERAHSEVGPNEHGYFDHRDHIADIGLYERDDAPIVIINAATGERHPFWSELDTHPDAISAGEQLLMMRPAVNFEEGARYVVALRNLKSSDGSVIAPRPEFVAYRSGTGADPARQAHFNTEIFPVLEGAGVARDDLYLAWDFTVASERNLAERVLHIRDDAFGRILGDSDLADRMVQGDSPEFVIDRVSLRTDKWTDSRGRAHSQELRRVEGRVTVPNYLDRIQQTAAHVGLAAPADAPVPGSRFLDTNGDGLPDQNPVESTVRVPFICDVPLNGRENIAGLYGHGLLGSRTQINDFNESPRRDGDFFGCAADWWGMSINDLPTVLAIIGDLSLFPSLPDRAQQGFLNFMFVGRAAVHPDGFATDPAFQQDGKSLVNTDTGDGTDLVYDGNSQGGIMGGSLVAVSPDIHRGILGVTGMNYSTLLNRSVDWEGEFAVPFYANYRDPIERQVAFSLMEMLWERAEANGYAAHMTNDPLNNTPEHEVMLQVAFSDHQVTNVSAEVEARTIGAPVMTPGLGDGRHWALDPFIETAEYPYQGSALIYWDSGNATPPNGNIPADENGDPHEHPREEPAASWQEAHFLLTGQMFDVCEGGDYLTKRHPSNNGTASCHPPEWAAGSEPPQAKEATTLSLEVSGRGSHRTLVAHLTESDSGQAVVGKTIEFFADGKSFGTATTDFSGAASIDLPPQLQGGHHEFEARFAGDDFYLQSSGQQRT